MWRAADSLGIRAFLQVALNESVPDQTTISRTRRLMDVETHQTVFAWVLSVLAETGLLRGKTIGIDATTLEANAALRSIVRRDSGESYDEFLQRLAKESGIETPTRAQLARLDRKRAKKGSNEEWTHPHDPDARITTMKDGRTHLAHKAEHAVDMETGAVVATGRAGRSRGRQGISQPPCGPGACDAEIRTYISEPGRGRQHWAGRQLEQQAVYANRRRARGDRGRRLQRQRGEKLERVNAHLYETGSMRRVHLRGHNNILKRLLIHVCALNLGLLMRAI